MNDFTSADAAPLHINKTTATLTVYAIPRVSACLEVSET